MTGEPLRVLIADDHPLFLKGKGYAPCSAAYPTSPSSVRRRQAGRRSRYVLKDTHEEELVRAIRAFAHGEAIFGPAVATRVLAYFATSRRPAPLFPSLTEREREILGLIAQGKSNLVIAHALSLSPK